MCFGNMLWIDSRDGTHGLPMQVMSAELAIGGQQAGIYRHTVGVMFSAFGHKPAQWHSYQM